MLKAENQFKVVDGVIKRTHKVIVHKFQVSDVEDPDLYAAEPLHNWEKSEQGQWVMTHAEETPVWHRSTNPLTYSTNYVIVAKLADKNYTFWQLKWGTK